MGGLVLAESMVHGTPVVAFIEKTYQLLNNENQRKNYIVHFDEAIDRFSPTVIRSQLFNMIETVIAFKYGRK